MGGEWRVADRLAVDLCDLEPSPASTGGIGQGSRPCRGYGCVIERDQTLAAAFHEHERSTVVDNDEGASRTRWTDMALRPRQRRTEGLTRVGGGEHDGHTVVGGAAQSVHSASEGELGCAEASDEIAAPDLALVLESSEHRINAGEAAKVPFTKCGLSCQHAVALQELHRSGVGRGCGVRTRFEQRRNQ